LPLCKDLTVHIVGVDLVKELASEYLTLFKDRKFQYLVTPRSCEPIFYIRKKKRRRGIMSDKVRKVRVVFIWKKEDAVVDKGFLPDSPTEVKEAIIQQWSYDLSFPPDPGEKVLLKVEKEQDPTAGPPEQKDQLFQVEEFVLVPEEDTYRAYVTPVTLPVSL
jgi:hypothetical protein